MRGSSARTPRNRTECYSSCDSRSVTSVRSVERNIVVSRMRMGVRAALVTAGLVSAVALIVSAGGRALSGSAAGQSPQSLPPTPPPFSDWRTERPGAIHKITVADLPKPYATSSALNQPRLVPRPDGAMPAALPGYTVTEYASGLLNPRLLRVAPNGDVFVAE